MSSLAEANKKVHKVEDQWHYKYLTPAGYIPLDKEQAGLVRHFKYQKGDEIVTASTGYSADHWKSTTGAGGYWSDLKDYCDKQIGDK